MPRWIDFILKLLFPHTCCHCGLYHLTPLCAVCFEQIEFYPLPFKLALEPAYLDQVTAASSFTSPLGSTVKAMKYHSLRDVCSVLATILYWYTNWPQADVITSVPLHYLRKRQRGFNQAEKIAREVSRLTGIPYVELLERPVQTSAQALSQSKKERLEKLSHVFRWNDQLLLQHQVLSWRLPVFPYRWQLKAKTALIIDDVMTTGATLNECAKILKQQGFNTVFGLVVAHDSS